jgi:hypothetical protein
MSNDPELWYISHRDEDVETGFPEMGGSDLVTAQARAAERFLAEHPDADKAQLTWAVAQVQLRYAGTDTGYQVSTSACWRYDEGEYEDRYDESRWLWHVYQTVYDAETDSMEDLALDGVPGTDLAAAKERAVERFLIDRPDADPTQLTWDGAGDAENLHYRSEKTEYWVATGGTTHDDPCS